MKCVACEKEITGSFATLTYPPDESGDCEIVKICNDCMAAVDNCILTINEEEALRDEDKDIGPGIEIELTNAEDFFKNFFFKDKK